MYFLPNVLSQILCALLGILVFVHVPDELQREIFHFPLENLVKTFILLNSHVTFPVSNGTWEEKQGNRVNEDSVKRGPDAFVLLGGTCFALLLFFPSGPHWLLHVATTLQSPTSWQGASSSS